MSIKVRMAIQPVLDEAGLSPLHADLHTVNGLQKNNYVRLVGECGKPYVTLHGIRFSSTNPPKEEVKYVAGLVEEFVQKHGEKLRTVLSLSQEKEKFNRAVRSATEKLGSREGVKNVMIENFCSKIGRCVSIQFSNGSTFSHSFGTAETFLSHVDAECVLHQKEIEDCFSYMDDLYPLLSEMVESQNKYLEIEEKLHAVLKELESCDI